MVEPALCAAQNFTPIEHMRLWYGKEILQGLCSGWILEGYPVLGAGASNYIPQILWGVITCLCLWYMVLTHKFSISYNNWSPRTYYIVLKLWHKHCILLLKENTQSRVVQGGRSLAGIRRRILTPDASKWSPDSHHPTSGCFPFIPYLLME